MRDGCAEAFGENCERHRHRFVALARTMLRNEEDAKDAVQDAFLSAYRNRHSLRTEASWTPWMYRIVVNVCLMKLRGRRRRQEFPMGDFASLGETGGVASERTSGFESPEFLVDHREMRSTLHACLALLPDSYRAVVRLRDLEGLDTAETAKTLRTSPNAVKIRLHRARRELRILLRDRVSGRWSHTPTTIRSLPR